MLAAYPEMFGRKAILKADTCWFLEEIPRTTQTHTSESLSALFNPLSPSLSKKGFFSDGNKVHAVSLCGNKNQELRERTDVSQTTLFATS